MFKSIQVVCLVWFLLVSSLVKGVEPVAKISGPHLGIVSRDVVLSFAGSESELPLEYEVALAPVNSVAQLAPLYDKDQKLTYAMFVPDQPGRYRFAVISSANDPNTAGKVIRKYGFHDVLVKDKLDPDQPVDPPDPIRPPDPIKPPDPIRPPDPDRPPTPQIEDKYGLYSFCKSVLIRIPDNGTWKGEAPGVAKVFTDMANQAGAYKDPNKFVLDTSNTYKSYLGASYPFWSQYFFNALKAQLAVLNSSGKLPSDVPSHAEAWREVAAALNEVRP